MNINLNDNALEAVVAICAVLLFMTLFLTCFNI